MPRLTNRQLDLIQTKIKEAIQAKYAKVFPKYQVCKPGYTEEELYKMVVNGEATLRPFKDQKQISSHGLSSHLYALYTFPAHPALAAWEAENQARNTFRNRLEKVGKDAMERIILEGSAAALEIDAIVAALEKVIPEQLTPATKPLARRKRR